MGCFRWISLAKGGMPWRNLRKTVHLFNSSVVLGPDRSASRACTAHSTRMPAFPPPPSHSWPASGNSRARILELAPAEACQAPEQIPRLRETAALPEACSRWHPQSLSSALHGSMDCKALQGRKILSPPGMLSLPAYEHGKSGVAPDRVQTRVRVLP